MQKFYFVILNFMILLFLTSCNKTDEVNFNVSQIFYKGISPIEIREFDESKKKSTFSLKKRIELRYPLQVGDTLDVSILEFKSDVYALDYYLNSGNFQGIIPILRGAYLEQSIRSDSRIFIFRHNSFRRYERSDLESYVRSFPGYHGGFPQEFLSLPFENREVGKTSIQTRDFLGVKSFFPVLVQSYRNYDLQWNVARSWEQINESVYREWASQLKFVNPIGIKKNEKFEYFTSGEGVNGILTQLLGGRIVVVWGYLSWFDLEKMFNIACNRVYESRF